VRTGILVTLEMSIEMVCAFVGAVTEVASMSRSRLRRCRVLGSGLGRRLGLSRS
jgi:hypothetical protein